MLTSSLYSNYTDLQLRDRSWILAFTLNHHVGKLDVPESRSYHCLQVIIDLATWCIIFGGYRVTDSFGITLIVINTK